MLGLLSVAATPAIVFEIERAREEANPRDVRADPQSD
jgi:hypothetical protein